MALTLSVLPKLPLLEYSATVCVLYKPLMPSLHICLMPL